MMERIGEILDGPDPLFDRIREEREKRERKGRIRRFLEDVADAYAQTEIEFTPGVSFREFE
jgi:hypothetical protein